jgi:hypothetical protein
MHVNCNLPSSTIGRRINVARAIAEITRAHCIDTGVGYSRVKLLDRRKVRNAFAETGIWIVKQVEIAL